MKNQRLIDFKDDLFPFPIIHILMAIITHIVLMTLMTRT